jgi:hypothetical protein
MDAKKPCFLRQTMVTLADGKAYSFRALPFSRRTMPLLKVLLDDEGSDLHKIDALLEAVEISLSYDHSEEEVRDILESGLVVPTKADILNALIAGMA